MKTMKRTIIVVVLLINTIVVFSQSQYNLLAFVEKMEWWIPYSKLQTHYQSNIKPIAEITSSYNGLLYNSSINYVRLGKSLYEAIIVVDREEQNVAFFKLEPKDKKYANNNPFKEFDVIFKDLTDLYGEPYFIYDERKNWYPRMNHVVKQYGWKTEGVNDSLMIVLNLLKEVPWDLSFDREKEHPCFVHVDIMPYRTMIYMINNRKDFFNKTVQNMCRVRENYANKEHMCESCFFEKPWNLVTGLNVETEKKEVKYVREGYSTAVLYKLDGNNIYCGQTNKLLFKIENNLIKDVASGKSIGNIEGHSVKSPKGKILYTIDGDFIRQGVSSKVLYTIK